MTPRPDVVEQLVTAALEAMTEIAAESGCSNDEIMSAYFTLVRRGIMAAQHMSPVPNKTREALRQTLYSILADVADDVRN